MKENHSANIKKNKDFSIMQWIGILGISAFLAIFPYQSVLFNGNGYQFEKDLYLAMILTFTLLSFSVIHLIRNWTINNTKSLLSIFVLLIPSLYYISSLHAVSVHNANIMMLIYFMLSAFFIFGLYYADSNLAQKIFPLVVTLSCYSIVVYGVIIMFGQVYHPGAIWFTMGEYRLASLFQYPNTYAGFMSALLLVAFYWVVVSKQWYMLLLHSYMLIPISISILLTLSRGALVILPLLVLLFLLFFRIQQQLIILFHMFITAVITFSITSPVTAVYNEIAQIVQSHGVISITDPLAMKGWLIVLSASLIVYAIIYMVNRWAAHRIDSKPAEMSVSQYSPLLIPIVSIVLGVIIIMLFTLSDTVRGFLPENVANRLENINFNQHSVLERSTFYKDAFKVVRDYPLLGTGGGGWTAVYEQYQNNPYVSRQAHSYFIQSLVEIGWVGFFFLIAFIIAVYLIYIRLHIKHIHLRGNHFVFFIFSSVLLIHSLIDFDMSYIYLSILVFFCMGAMLAPYTDKLKLTRWEPFGNSKLRYIYPVALIFLAFILLVGSMREYNANRSYSHALYLASVEKKPLEEVLIPLDNAIHISPSNAAYSLRKIEWLNQAYYQSNNKLYLNSVKELIERTKHYELYNRELILAEYRNYKDLGDYKEAVRILEVGISKFQWDIKFYAAAIMEYSVLGHQNSASDQQIANQNWSRALELYEEVLNRTAKLKNLPEEQLQGREFNVSPFIRQAIGSIYFFKKDYPKAISLLEQVKAGDLSDPDIRACIRYYLASLRAVGQEDKRLQNLLIAVDSREKIALEELSHINSNP